MKKKIPELNILRALLVLAVLLYHLGFLPGGYLAVCSFFVLSGFLSANSIVGREDFSIGRHYKSRLLKLYIPLACTVFMTLAVFSFCKGITWISLKPESTSILLGYNNFWQIGANMDYFARHQDSPFMHMWYIAILLQFDLVFPLIGLLLRKAKAVAKKVITGAFAVVSAGVFVWFCLNRDINVIYYNTFSRVFALFLGVFAYTVIADNKSGRGENEKREITTIAKVVLWVSAAVLIALYIFVDAASAVFSPAMGVATIITCFFIAAAYIQPEREEKALDKLCSAVSTVSYEFYLVQYPVIYFWKLSHSDEISPAGAVITVLISAAIAAVLHFALNGKKLKKGLAVALAVIVGAVSVFGGYQYVTAEDHTAELKALEEQLAANEEEIRRKQEEYQKAAKAEDDDWQGKLLELENGEEELKEIVKNMKITAIGDSVMLGSSSGLYGMFPNIYIDAEASRTCYVVNPILLDLLGKGMLADTIVFHLGTNGNGPARLKDEIMATVGTERDTFWLNITNDWQVHSNEGIYEFINKYENAHLIDWLAYSKGHPEFFGADGIHVVEAGRKAYAQCIYEALYDFYLNKYNNERDALIAEHEAKMKKKISFIGNSLLINMFDGLFDSFPSASYDSDQNWKAADVKAILEEKISDGSLSHRVVLMLDKNTAMGEADFRDLEKLCKDNDKELYIVNSEAGSAAAQLYGKDSAVNPRLIDLSEEFGAGEGFYSFDGVHLTEKGNAAVIAALEKVLN